MKNKIFNQFGTYASINNECYEINKTIIFGNNKEYIITNYILDEINQKEFIITGETKRKMKIDLSLKHNFIVKSDRQNSWNNKTQYTLYLYCENVNYKFIDLSLNGERLDINYTMNDIKCNHCIGWNHKEKNNVLYGEYKEQLKKLDYLRIDNEDYEKELKKLNNLYKKYKKVKEKEASYTAYDYKYMSLASGTTEEENKTMLKANGFNI